MLFCSDANGNCISLLKSLKVCRKTNWNKETSETRPKSKGSCLHWAACCNINEISVPSVAKQRRRRVVLSVMGLGNGSAVSITLSTRAWRERGGVWELFCFKWRSISIMWEEDGCTEKLLNCCNALLTRLIYTVGIQSIRVWTDMSCWR